MNPFSLVSMPCGSGWIRRLWAAAAGPAECLLGLRTLGRLYQHTSSREFVESALDVLGITVALDSSHLDGIPKQGPLIVVANHPTGALDGLAIAASVSRVRPDVRLLGNQLLERIPEMRRRVIAVDAFRSGSVISARGVRRARRWLEAGGALVVFPAGEVSSIPRAGGVLVDRPWHRGVLRLVEWTHAAVTPIFVEGQNRRWFHWAGSIHPWLRTALLPRELLARRGSRMSLVVGATIAAERLLRLVDDEARLAYLRARTYGLRPDFASQGHLMWRRGRHASVPVASPESAEVLRREVAGLPAVRRLVASGSFEVYCVPAQEIPTVLREIGRLRELTFRESGEGTGLERDTDRFDLSYRHLFVWHRDRDEVVGAYRLGLTDDITASHGLSGLYTRTLFRFGPQLLEEIGPAIELGRSFVRREYQRESHALFLLWKGIGRFVSQNPRYRRLYGPVSISADYQSFTRQLLARFLSNQGFISELAGLVRPMRPLPLEVEASLLVRSKVVAHLDDVETLVRELESGRGIPVLLRQYLKLNARLLGFNLDPDFGNVLDGLMLVDLLDVKPAMLQRYLGRDGMAEFLAFHQHRPATPLQPERLGALQHVQP